MTSVEGQARRKPRLLLVDDDPRMRDVIGDLLDGDYDVVGEAGTGAGAVDELARLLTSNTPPDAVVLDYVLPDHDGLQVAPQLRALVPDLPIVLFSSLFDRSLSVQAAALGLHYVEKAAGVQALEATIEAAIALRTGVTSEDPPGTTSGGVRPVGRRGPG